MTPGLGSPQSGCPPETRDEEGGGWGSRRAATDLGNKTLSSVAGPLHTRTAHRGHALLCVAKHRCFRKEGRAERDFSAQKCVAECACVCVFNRAGVPSHACRPHVGAELPKGGSPWGDGPGPRQVCVCQGGSQQPLLAWGRPPAADGGARTSDVGGLPALRLGVRGQAWAGRSLRAPPWRADGRPLPASLTPALPSAGVRVHTSRFDGSAWGLGRSPLLTSF